MAQRKNHRISIQRQSSAQDAAGQLVDSWTTTATIWASIVPLRGREYFNASGERATVTHQVFIYYGTDVVPRDRIVYGSRILDIDDVFNVDERNMELKLMCTEHVN